MNRLKAIEAGAALAAFVPFITGITTEEDYNEARALVDEMADNNDVDNPLLHILMDKIYDYERQLPEIIEFFEDAQRTPNDVGILRTLINQYNLTLSDLPEIGSKSMVSRVLSGERKLTLDHIRKLSARFGISPALFIS